MPLPESTSQRRKSPWTFAIVGFGIALLALLLSEFVSVPHGHRIDFEKLPPEVQAILTENRDGAISPDQWRRAEKALRPYGGWRSGQRPYWAETVIAGWKWFVFLPLTGLAFIAARRTISAWKAVWIFSPSLLLLAAAIAILNSGSQ